MPVTYQLIASNTLSSSAASVTFSSIPGTFTDIVLRLSVRSDRVANSANLGLKINGATTNYSSVYMLKTESGTATGGRIISTDLAYSYLGVSNAANSTSNTFTSAEVYFPSYTISQNKSFSVFGAFENNDTNVSMIIGSANLYSSTSAITSLEITSPVGPSNFVSGSSFFLYGIKNS